MTFRVYIIILITAIFSHNLCAQEKPLIKIVFEIRQKEYLDYYRKELSELEKTISDSIARIFNKYTPFYNFQSGIQSDDSLSIYLEGVIGLDLRLILKGQNVSPCDPIIWEILTDQDFEDYISPNTDILIDGIGISIRKQLDININQVELLLDKF